MKSTTTNRVLVSFGLLFFLFVIPISALNYVSAIPAQTTTITFWYTENDTEKPGVTAMVTAFEAANPTIDVVASQKGFFNARNDYQSAFIAGEEPDVFRATRDWIPEFANSEMLQPLTDMFTTEEWGEFINMSVEMATYPDPATGEDEIWAVCQTLDTPALMYNKYLFEEGGVNTTEFDLTTSLTWEEYWDLVVAVNQTEGVYATVLGGMFFGAQPYFFGHGGGLFENDTVTFETIALDSIGSREGLAFTKNLTDSTYTHRWEEQGWTNLNIFFIDEASVAMISQGPWELKNFLENSVEFNPNLANAKPYADPLNLGIMQLPHDENGNSGAPVGGQWYVVSKNTQNAEFIASKLFIEYITSEEVMADKIKEFYHVPARPSVMERPDILIHDHYPYVKGYYDAVLSATTIPVDHRWASIEQRLADNLDEYLAGDLTLDECIEATIAEWRIIIPPAGSGGIDEPEVRIPGYQLSIVLGSFAIGLVSIVLKRRKNN